jgi:Domain of unknown function (DUF4190)
VASRQDGDGGLPADPETETSRLAVASLVLGLGGVLLFLGPVAGIPAVCCGAAALRQIRRYPGAFTGRGMAAAGIALGCAAIALSLAAMIVWRWAAKEWTR